MKTLVVYDSVFGNTAKVAQAIGEALSSCPVIPVSQASPEQLRGVELLIVGSPTRGFRPTPALMTLLKRLPARALQGVRVAAFDTRIRIEAVNNKFLTFMVRLFGYADSDIQKVLQQKGGIPAAESAGFYVKASEGPLEEGELERAIAWAKRLAG